MSADQEPAAPRRLDDLTEVVLAPNPSPMTLEGTNTYLLGLPDHGAAVVVDPGPDVPVHRAAVVAALRGREVAAVVITHHHVDHAAAAHWAEGWHAPLRSFDPALIPGAVQLRDGEVLDAAGLDLAAIHTPGHASDHLCLRVVATDVVLTGDHVLGRGTSVVNWPDGDMSAYMASLDRLARAPGRALYPGHGPVVHDAGQKVREYIDHRHQRRIQVREAVEAGATTAAEVVATVYADVPAVLHPAAERSVQAVLAMMAERGEVPASMAPDRGGHGDPSALGR